MQASKIISKTLANNLIRYACIVAMIVLTPLFAKPMASLFDWAVLKWSKAGDLREFWEEFLVAFFWILEWVGYLLVKKFLMKKLYTKETVLVEIENRENAAIEEAAIAEVNTKGKVLPSFNVGMLFLIASACILLITLQIGFNVKPFWELGNKVTQSNLIFMCGEAFKNAIKCVWVVAILRLALWISGEVVENLQIQEKHKKLFQWIGVGILILFIGVLDVLLFKIAFWWTYLLFYVAFAAIYYFTEQSLIKTYLLILFIYLF